MLPTGSVTVLMLLLTGGLSLHGTQSPRLPSWLVPPQDMSDRAELRQSATLAASEVRICRTMVNVSRRPLLVPRLLSSEGRSHQFSSWFFTSRGDMIYPRHALGHGLLIPPIIPSGPDDMSPFQIVAPGGDVGSCVSLALPPNGVFQIVSTYRSDLVEDYVPARFRNDFTVIPNDQLVVSGVCIVRVRSRSVVCANERRWTVESHPTS